MIRPRRPEDVPALAEVLTAQRDSSRYPMRWPLPYPTERFVARDTELAAWAATVGGAPVGHVAALSVRPDEHGVLASEAQAWVAGSDRPPEQLGVLSTLFTAVQHRGTGLGRQLHDTAVAAIRAQDRTPCLDVVPEHHPAVDVYRHLGWRTVGEVWPGWLPDGAGPVLAMVLD
ncbi:MAG: GNAT family N-acetyltransferase [Actinobacteria bacterium]|jgi:GNAT superfamily N-acetyltransferase|nr:GNAT family N-acetyltransferase [Actinomycetota bacterium]